MSPGIKLGKEHHQCKPASRSPELHSEGPGEGQEGAALGGEGQPQAAQGGEAPAPSRPEHSRLGPARSSAGLTPNHSGCHVASSSLVPDGGPGISMHSQIDWGGLREGASQEEREGRRTGGGGEGSDGDQGTRHSTSRRNGSQRLCPESVRRSWVPRIWSSKEPAIQVDACLLEVFGCRVQAKRKKPGVDLVYLLTV